MMMMMINRHLVHWVVHRYIRHTTDSIHLRSIVRYMVWYSSLLHESHENSQ